MDDHTTTPDAAKAQRSIAILLPGRIEPDGLEVRERAVPVPGAGQVLIELAASGISFAEQAMRRGRYPGQPRFPFVPGYDLVGKVRSVGPGVAESQVGTMVAAVTKTGSWATHSIVPAADLVPVPAGLDPTEVETVIVNGVTAWQMLYRKAHVTTGQTVLVHGANGGVGTILAQLARHTGARVIGTAAPRHHDALRALGVEPVDYADPNLFGRIRELAPDGVDAAFDHLGLESARRSYGLLARGGTLVSYGTASGLKDSGSVVALFIALMTQLTWWNVLPNTHRAVFYNFWTGHLTRRNAFRRRLRDDLTSVLALLTQGAVVPQVAARFPLAEVSAAMRLAESRTVLGKVVLVP